MRWFLAVGGQTQGPYEDRQLVEMVRDGIVASSSPVCPEAGGPWQPLSDVLDFGVSKLAAAGPKLTRTGCALGTPEYMSPEQALGQPDVDARTDVYAIGVMLYEALAGRPPIAGSSPSEVIGRLFTEVPPPVRQFSPGLPPPIDALVARAIAKDRAARFDDCPAARAPRSRANPRVPRLPHLPQQPHPLPQAPNPHRPNRPP